MKIHSCINDGSITMRGQANIGKQHSCGPTWFTHIDVTDDNPSQVENKSTAQGSKPSIAEKWGDQQKKSGQWSNRKTSEFTIFLETIGQKGK